jgi:hypothetical protein
MAYLHHFHVVFDVGSILTMIEELGDVINVHLFCADVILYGYVIYITKVAIASYDVRPPQHEYCNWYRVRFSAADIAHK